MVDRFYCSWGPYITQRVWKKRQSFNKKVINRLHKQYKRNILNVFTVLIQKLCDGSIKKPDFFGSTGELKMEEQKGKTSLHRQFRRKWIGAYKDARLVFTDIQSDLSSNKCCNLRILLRDNRLFHKLPWALTAGRQRRQTAQTVWTLCSAFSFNNMLIFQSRN